MTIHLTDPCLSSKHMSEQTFSSKNIFHVSHLLIRQHGLKKGKKEKGDFCFLGDLYYLQGNIPNTAIRRENASSRTLSIGLKG